MDEESRQRALAGAGRADEEAGRPSFQPTAEQPVQRFDAALDRLEILVLRLAVSSEPRVDLQAAGSDAEVMVASAVRHPTHLDHPKQAADLAVSGRRLL